MLVYDGIRQRYKQASMQKANSCRLLSSAHCMPVRLFLANHQDDPYQMATNKEAKRDIQPVLVHSAALLQVFNTHPKYKGRVSSYCPLLYSGSIVMILQADLVQSLISAYHLDKILRYFAHNIRKYFSLTM